MSDQENVWYCGSAHVLTIVKKGGIITQWADLAMVRSLCPRFLTLSEDKERILHDGKGRGYLYEVIGPVSVEKDLEPAESPLGEGVEWRTLKPFRLKFVCNSVIYPEDVLKPEDVERLQKQREKEK